MYSPSRISAVSLLEITAYHLTLQGRFFLRRDEFEPALEHLAVARYLLSADALAKDTNTSRDLALYTLFSDEIAPQIRFAAHSLGHKTAYDIDAVVKGVASSKVLDHHVPDLQNLLGRLKEERAKEAGSSSAGSRAMLREPIWEGAPVPIRNPELVDVFLKVQNAEDAMDEGKAKQARSSKPSKDASAGKENAPAPKSTRGKVAAFDGILLALTDAESVAQKLVESKEVCTTSIFVMNDYLGLPRTDLMFTSTSFLVLQMHNWAIPREAGIFTLSTLMPATAFSRAGSSVIFYLSNPFLHPLLRPRLRPSSRLHLEKARIKNLTLIRASIPVSSSCMTQFCSHWNKCAISVSSMRVLI